VSAEATVAGERSPPERSGGARSLDFIVIGTQKGGTTSLWQLLRHHPSISMPERKEVPFFARPESEEPAALAEYMAMHFGDAPGDCLLGKATPRYMMGSRRSDVERIAQRLSAVLPSVKLIALLRDPIERAASHHRMAVRFGWEQRGFEGAVEELLEPRRLEQSRRLAEETNSYVTQGEYGRILGAYLQRFPRERLHVELTSELDADPGGLLARVLSFLSLPPDYRPPRLDVHYNRGGVRNLLDREAHDGLAEFLEDNVWPGLGKDAERVRRLFEAFMQIWDVKPESGTPALSMSARERLEAHYASDAETLAELGIAAPWIAAWRRGEAL